MCRGVRLTSSFFWPFFSSESVSIGVSSLSAGSGTKARGQIYNHVGGHSLLLLREMSSFNCHLVEGWLCGMSETQIQPTPQETPTYTQIDTYLHLKKYPLTPEETPTYTRRDTHLHPNRHPPTPQETSTYT